MSGIASAARRRGSRVGAVLLSTALASQLSVPAFAALVLLAGVLIGVICWVIVSEERTERVSQLLLASRGETKSLSLKSAVSDRLAPAPHRVAQPGSLDLLDIK